LALSGGLVNAVAGSEIELWLSPIVSCAFVAEEIVIANNIARYLR
jgi:hypothetical protein